MELEKSTRISRAEPPRTIRFFAATVLLLGGLMLIYWTMYIMQGMPVGDIPILSEMVTALLALITGYGLWLRRPWAVPFSLVLAGMWGYAVIGGIALVIKYGLDFSSPLGALTDTVLFPLILLYSIFMAIMIWHEREWFRQES